MNSDYELIIIGGGIAGLTAAIYGARAHLKTLILERQTCGGLANWAVEIENFPSHEKISGITLMERVKTQAEKLGAEIREIVEISAIQFNGQSKRIETDEGTFQAKAVIVATGREPIRLPLEVDSDHIHYCAICDGSVYRGRDVLVVGGGNSGTGDALYLLNQGVRTIILIEQMDRLLANQASQKALCAHPEVTILTSTEISGIAVKGKDHWVTLKNSRTGETQTIEAGGIFVYIGQAPQTGLFKGILEMDDQGYILGDETMETNVEGIFVAGDVRHKTYRQLTTAMNDGTIAALAAEAYLRSLRSDSTK
ncbi:MAG: FAD-dependent oxidoreductase [Deltaproteobacteria bacterium]|nr:FAD-dependent oxidoreductase [Deltaproteobacteria bacterium]